MIVTILDFSTLQAITAAPAVSWSLVLDSVEADPSHVTVAASCPRSYAGAWALIDGVLYYIESVSPGEAQSELTLASPLDAFARPLLYQEPKAGTTAGQFIVQALLSGWACVDDSVYAAPYLAPSATDGIAFAEPELATGGLWNIPAYARSLRASSGLWIRFTLRSGTLYAQVVREQYVQRTVVFNDGHAQLDAATFSERGLAKLSVWQGATESVYYLASDGTISNVEPADRAPGRWSAIAISDDEDPATAAAEAFSGAAEERRIEFYTDREFSVGDTVSLQLYGENYEADVSALTVSSSDKRTLVRLGTLAITAAQKIRKLERTAAAALNGTRGEAQTSTTQTATRTVSVSYADTIRYISVNNAWKRVRDWKTQNGINLDYSVFGVGRSDRNAACIPLSGLAIEGTTSALQLRMKLFVSSPDVHTFRWAICTARNDSVYEGTGAAGADATRLAQGTFTPQYLGSTAKAWQSFSLPCSLPAGTDLYVYLWPNVASYGNCHLYDTVYASCVDTFES